MPLYSSYQYVLILIRILELKVSSSHKHGFDGPHAVVVMELGGKLLWAEPVGHHNLHWQRLCIKEAIRIQRDLSNERIVGDHHGHCAKQHLLRDRERKRKTLQFQRASNCISGLWHFWNTNNERCSTFDCVLKTFRLSGSSDRPA